MKFCSIASGSSGNSIYVGSHYTNLLIDAGLSGKRITNGLIHHQIDPQQIDGILITHEHRDHIHGAGILSRKYDIPIYATEKTWIAMENDLGAIKPYNKEVIYADEYFTINDLSIRPFSIPHDAADPVGYSICTEKKKICVATDMGHINNHIIENLYNSDLILIESNHDIDMLEKGSYPYHLKKRILGDRGHLSNVTTGKLISDILNGKLQYIFLGHLSHENNEPKIAYQTVSDILNKKHGCSMKSKFLSVALRDQTSDLIEI